MAYPQLGDLAGSAADRILMAFHACRRVEYRTEPESSVLSFLKDLLIADETVSGRFRDAVTGAFRTSVLGLQGRSVKSRWCFGRGLLSYQANRSQAAA